MNLSVSRDFKNMRTNYTAPEKKSKSKNLTKYSSKMRKIAVYEQCLGNRKIMKFDSIFTLVPSKFQDFFEVFE